MHSWTLLEASKLSIIEQSLKGTITVKRAAEQLELSRRQIYRLRARLMHGGPSKILHGNLGRSPANATKKSVKRKALAVFSEWRSRCGMAVNASHLRDILERDHGIKISRQTSWNWLQKQGAVACPRRKRRHRLRRERECREGSILFLDGSPHRWFGPNERKTTLILCSDDATGKALYGIFTDSEDRDGCFHVAYEVFMKFGLPSKFYLDRASQFVTTRSGKPELPPPTEWQRAMRELGIACVFATSPQARGRGERLNGSFQSRLCHELAYRKVKTKKAANRFLNEQFIVEHNQRYAVAAKELNTAWRKPPARDLRTILCAKATRHVSRDNTVLHSNMKFQLLPHPSGVRFTDRSVEAQDWFDGSIRFFHDRVGLINSVAVPR